MITRREDCRLCGGRTFTMVLDLHDQPPANRNMRYQEWLTRPEPMYPLRVYWCHQCHLLQLLDVVSKEELYRNYPFVSSGVGNTPKHFQEYAAEMQRRFLEPGDFVVEIGGNDGVLLTQLKNVKTLNVDPAENIAPFAERRGIKTLVEFFDLDVAKRIARDYGQANVIMGNNSIAHIDDQQCLVAGIAELLTDDGVFILQAPYLGDLFDTLGYGMIYHEHLSYFAIRPLIAFYRRHDLEIFDYQLVPFQGTSIRIYISRRGRYPVGDRVRLLAEEEHSKGWDRLEAYQQLAKRIQASRDKLVHTLIRLRQEGKRIAAYGAAAKGMSILNYAGITHELIDFCVDGLPQKQGLYTPMSHIPIISPEAARTRQVDYYLLLAWNFRDLILEKENAFVKRGGKFIIPIRDIETYHNHGYS